MSRPKNRPWVPRLRFPEFRDAGAWEAKEIQECLEYERPDRFIVNSDNYHQSGTPVLTANQSFILGYTNEHDGICNHLPAVIFDDFTTDMKYVDFPFKVKSSAIKILRTKEGHNLSFLYELIHRMPFDASQHKRHYISEYQHQVIKLPRLKEQSKIADCLSSLDALIAALSRKIDTLKEHKKGLVQQLFPQEGETAPQLRFPEFRNKPEWQRKRLGEISDILMCKRIFANQTNPDEGVPFYKIGTLGKEPDAFISNDLFEEYRSRYSFPNLGEILVTCSGTIGKCFAYDGSEAYFQDSNIVWIDNPKQEVSNELLMNMLSNVNWNALNSTTITRIYGPDLRSLAITFPQSKYEQKRIADCLGSLDDLIAAEGRKLEALRHYKQGLMQQLFPVANESTV